MIQNFVDKFIASKKNVKRQLRESPPDNYEDIVKLVVNTISDSKYNDPDIDRIHSIDDGDFQGTLLFVIGANGYQPDEYWYVKVCYGSCSACDTLASIQFDGGYGGLITDQQVNDYYMLALHVVQSLKKMD